MYKGKFNESQRLAILAEQDDGKSIEDICRDHQINPATFYKPPGPGGRRIYLINKTMIADGSSS